MNKGLVQWAILGLLSTSLAVHPVHSQDDLDSLDSWVRSMHPDPFLRCGETAWLTSLDQTREKWMTASSMERIRLVNAQLQVLQDSHSAVSAYDWIWDVERTYGTLPIRWAIEGGALWVLDSGLPGLPEDVRVLALNGRSADGVVRDAMELSTMEGPSAGPTSRTAAHNITPWVLGTSRSSRLAVTWMDPSTLLPQTVSFEAVSWKQARRAWASISTRRPVVDWSFPDGTRLTPKDDRRYAREDQRLLDTGHARRIQTHWRGAATVKITSFSDGPWGRFHRRLAKGFERAKDLNCPVIIDLRGNPGGQSPRMESLWRHIATQPRHLPYALVAKQSTITARANGRYYKRLRKRWVDKHKDHSADAKYIYTMATLPLGETDTLFFPKKGRSPHAFRGRVAVLMDGESASASVSFAGAVQASGRGTLIGEPCMGPQNGTMGNPYMRRLPLSGIVVSLSTAVYMAEPSDNWATSRPIQPDLHIPAMWRRNGPLGQTVDDWIKTFQP